MAQAVEDSVSPNPASDEWPCHRERDCQRDWSQDSPPPGRSPVHGRQDRSAGDGIASAVHKSISSFVDGGQCSHKLCGGVFGHTPILSLGSRYVGARCESTSVGYSIKRRVSGIGEPKGRFFGQFFSERLRGPARKGFPNTRREGSFGGLKCWNPLTRLKCRRGPSAWAHLRQLSQRGAGSGNRLVRRSAPHRAGDELAAFAASVAVAR